MSSKEDGDDDADAAACADGPIDRYFVPVPRGLDHVVIEMVQDQLKGFQLAIQTMGETVDEASDLKASAKPGSAYQNSIQKHVSFGYHGDRTVWSLPGVWEGTVWLRIATNAPRTLLGELKCLGPLLAGVTVWEHVNLKRGLHEVLVDVHALLDQQYDKFFEIAVDLWKSHALNSWPLSEDQRQSIQDGAVKIRASCTRGQSKKLFDYSREDLLKGIVDTVIPKQFKWKVDLNNYHVEVVILVLSPTSLAIGLALRPYQLLGANCFHKNSIPPDVSSPYMTGGTLSGVLRLRPTTATILLELAKLEPGDIVVDPCVGIGTIPMQISKHAVGLGGDLVLVPTAFAGVASRYVQQHDANFRKSGNLMGWDASWLPLRSRSIDVVVSDLPFGHTCLSSAKLGALLPLVLGEMARVLRPDTGRAVLLCGAFAGIIQALETLNQASPNNWVLPCESVFPVNIGGIMAWVVMVTRGSGDGTRVQTHQERVQKMTATRERTGRQRQADLGREGTLNKRFRLQS
jgi:hypothetical protein